MNIVVGVCGSIAAYKSFDLVRGLTKSGHSVCVVLTQGALEFVKPEVFRHLGAQAVYLPQDDHRGDVALFAGLDSKQVLHIALARWAQKIIIAPMTANTLNKLGAGLADDLLSCLFLASKDDIAKLLFPAMNPAMWDNPIVKKNRTTLKSLPHTFLHDTATGEMVCGEHGDGKLATVDEMLDLAVTWNSHLRTKKILITTGATIAPLDPVRYLTNPSSGESGYELAKESLRLGFETIVIAGKYSTHKLEQLISHPRFTLLRIETTMQMQESVEKLMPACDVYISSAAIGDFHFKTSQQKIKKDQLSNTLDLEASPDILKAVLASRLSHQTIIGFAAETDLSIAVLEKKWRSKPVDLLIGTKVGFNQGFGHTSPYYIFYRGNQVIDFEGQLSKSELAHKILEIVSHDQTHSLHV